MNRKSTKELTTLEERITVAAVILSPLWFITPLGVNLTPTDFLIFTVAFIYILRTKSYPLFPSKLANIGFLIFVCTAVVSLVNTQNTVIVDSVFGIFQYIIIFFIIIPFVYLAAKNEASRYAMLMGIFLILLVVMMLTTITWIKGTPLPRIYLWYGGQQQLYWLIAVGGIMSLYLFADSRSQLPQRIIYLLPFGLAILLVSRSYILTSAILLTSSVWFLGVLVSARHGTKLLGRYFIVSIAAALFGALLIYHGWEIIVQYGAWESRKAQYTAAYNHSLNYFPFGSGLQSEAAVIGPNLPEGTATSIHSLYFSFLLQVGVVGLIGYIVYMLAWVREVMIGVLRNIDNHKYLYLAPIGVFFGLVIFSVFYYPPVRRFWWIMFALGWVVVSETAYESN